MARIVSFHSFRGGTGKSNITANVAAILAKSGKRVGVIDTDILSPGIHVLFGLDESQIVYSLNDYLWGRCEIQQVVLDVTQNLETAVSGKIYLIPSSIKAGEIARVLREGYDVGLLNEGFHDLIRDLSLDILLIDTHPGLNEETLLSIALSDALVVILRPDQQDYQGTGVTVQVARQLQVPSMTIVLNKLPSVFDPAEVKSHVEETYQCTVSAVLPHSDEMMALASSSIFVLRFPEDPLAKLLEHLAAEVASFQE